MTNELNQNIDSSFKMIFETQSAVMLLIESETGLIINANLAAIDFYGYPKSKLCSMLINDININPFVKVLMNLKNTQMFEQRLANGEIRTVEANSSIIDYDRKKVIFSIIHDITNMKLAEEKLSENNVMFRQILDAIPQSVFWKDLESNYLGCNKVFSKQVNLNSDEINQILRNSEEIVTRIKAKG